MGNSPTDETSNYTNTTSFDRIGREEELQHKEELGRNTSVSTAASYSHRDSRLQSIYDRYLYRQESKKLARNLSAKSTSKVAKRVASIKKMSHSASRKKRQSVGMANRESKPDNSAWAGMMMGNIPSDDSDSDESDQEAITRAPASSTSSKNSAGRSRGSWSSRAVAVGSRPPDSASQNPPTLKLLGLKSVKEGGAPIGFSSNQSSHLDVKQQQQQLVRNASPAFDMVADAAKDRIVSTSDYGDDVGRHGSYIEFGDAAAKTQASPTRGYQLHDGPMKAASSSLQPPMPASTSGPLSPRTALTKELGLVTPQPTSMQANSQTGSYFPPTQTSQSSPPRNLMTGGYNGQQITRYPQAPPPVTAPVPAQSIPLQRGPTSPSYPISPAENGQPPSNLAQMRSAASAPAPMPIPLPSPVYPPAVGAPMTGNPPSYYSERPSIDTRAAPTSNPGFSDSPQVGGRQTVRRQPSLLRRSMAFITGGGPAPPHQRQPSAGGGKKGLWRRSMAILTNRPVQPAAIPVNDELDSPLPRVAGFVDEKPKNRRSEYLGASGMGDEWDYSGYGAKFWKRFSVAQRREMEGANKDSENFRKKIEKRRRWIAAMSFLGGLVIIAGVIGIIIWREASPSSATPAALDRQNDGVNSVDKPSVGYDANNGSTVIPDTTYTSQTEYPTATGQDAAATTTSTTHHHHHNGNGRKRALATPASHAVQRIKREIQASAPSYYGGVHPLPRNMPAGDLIRRRKHSERALTTPLPLT